MPTTPLDRPVSATTLDAEVVDELERSLRALAEGLVACRPDECLYCYLLRMLEALGCDNTLRWAERWREQQAPSYPWLVRWLRSNGGFCDCEAIFNVFREGRRSQRHRLLRCKASYEIGGRAC